ncbi:MAG: N-acetyltransferase [Steroidobacteraceae bacterium]
MTVVVRPVSGKKEITQFVKFRIDLYRDSPYAIPPLYMDELTTLDPAKNPAFEFCEAQCFMAFDGDRPLGRICAMINRRANEVWNTRSGRFGFVDFIDDEAVSRALFAAAEEWVKARGMHSIHGPLGFTDLDQEGMLIQGFDQLGTMATIYNHPYYPTHVEKLGYVADADWVEYRLTFGDALPERPRRIAELVMKKHKLRILKYTSGSKFIKDGYGQKMFELLNSAYSHLYGFTPLTQAQIDYYLKLYVPMLNLEFLWLVVDESQDLVAFGVAMPSLSRALQKAQGRLFPFGFLHVLKALKMRNPEADLMLIAVRKDYQNKGANALIFHVAFAAFLKAGVKYAETNPELLENRKVQSQWEGFEHVNHKRRRAYKKELDGSHVA